MKSFRKFLIAAAALTAALTIMCSAVCAICLSGIRRASFDSELALIASVRAQYPDIPDEVILQSLHSPGNTEETEKFLRSRGITREDWIAQKNENHSAMTAALCTGLCMLTGADVMIVLVLFMKHQNRQMKKLTEYLSRLNHGDYRLDLTDSGEDEYSRLKSEIYRVTVTLREQSERTKKDKLALKDSISDISHQLKTPLTSAEIMLSRVIEDKNMPEDIRREFLSDIWHSVNDIVFLVRSLLTLSRLDADAIGMMKEETAVSGLFEKCMEKTEVLAELKGVLVTAGDCSGMKLICDKGWICEALSNILKNCIEHTPAGGSVKLSAFQNKLYTRISITDTGCGISGDDLPHIFERFYKGTNSSENSIGIGLSLSKAIIEKNGGYISVYSTPGEGSRFDIKLFHNGAVRARQRDAGPDSQRSASVVNSRRSLR